VLSECVRRIRGTFGEILFELKLLAERLPRMQRFRLSPLRAPDGVGRAEEPFGFLSRRKKNTVHVVEHDILSFYL
jgi:hypothetical protein